MNGFPKINIIYSASLDEVYHSYFSKQEDFQDSKHFSKVAYGKILTLDEMPEKMKALKVEWAKHQKQIFESMYKITSLSFSRNAIDVYVVRITPRSFSRPIIVSAKLPVDQNIRTMIHEFLHILINEALGSKGPLNKVLEDMFPGETPLTLGHIPIYAILALIYEEVFPGRYFIEFDKKQAINYKTNEYTRAIELGENYGFKKFVDDLKSKLVN